MIDNYLSVIIMLNLKNIEYVKRGTTGWGAGSRINAISLYKKMIEYLRNNNKLEEGTDNLTSATLEEINEFLLKNGNINSYQAITTRVNDFNHLFNNILGIKAKFKNISPKEILKSNEGIYTKEEIISICNLLLNAQDRFIVYALWYGIKDVRFYDMVSIRIDDVDFNNNTIKVGDKIIVMDNVLAIYTKLAIEQQTYFKMGDVDNVNDSYDLNMNNPYIIKPKPQRNNSMGLYKMTPSGFRTRILNLEFSLEEYGVLLKPQKLYLSGVLYKMYEEGLKKNINWNTVTLEKFKKENNIKIFSVDTLLAFDKKYGGNYVSTKTENRGNRT